MLVESLKKYGLKEKEAMIYLACLELDIAPVSKISLKAKIPRVLSYEILNRLAQKGLVSVVTISNKKYFRASRPEKFLSILRDREEAINNILPQLKLLKNNKPAKKPELFIHDGKIGLKTILDEILNIKPKELLILGGGGQGEKILPNYLKKFHETRENIGIPLRIILGTIRWAKDRSKFFAGMANTSIRLVQKKYLSPISTYIYSDKVCFMFWVEAMPMAILIESVMMQEVYHNHFETMWSTSAITKKE